MTDYTELLDKVRRLIASERRVDEKLVELCGLLHRDARGFDLVSFFTVDPDNWRQLVRGAHAGEPSSVVTIPFGQGLCGQAAERGISMVVGDVSQELNYMVGHPETRSEIVLPIFRSGQVVAELDIGSFAPDRFDAADRLFLEEVCLLLTDRV